MLASVHLPSPAGMSNSVARRRTSPLGEVSPVHLPSPAGTSNPVARRRTLPLGEISPVHLLSPAGLSNPVAASVARTACVHARFIWKFFLLLQMSLSPWRPVGVVNILKRPGPLCRRAAAIAEGRADFRRKAFHRGGAERSHPKAEVVKSAFEPSLVCRFAGNAAPPARRAGDAFRPVSRFGGFKAAYFAGYTANPARDGLPGAGPYLRRTPSKTGNSRRILKKQAFPAIIENG